eukprot:3230846-Rhodomonas_salina.1
MPRHDKLLSGRMQTRPNAQFKEAILGLSVPILMKRSTKLPENWFEISLTAKGYGLQLQFVLTLEYRIFVRIWYAALLPHALLERILMYQIDRHIVNKGHPSCVIGVAIADVLWEHKVPRWTISVKHPQAYANVYFLTGEDAVWADKHRGSFTISENPITKLGLL